MKRGQLGSYPESAPDADLVYASYEKGYVDIEPIGAIIARKSFDEIFDAGGVFVVFPSAKEDFNYCVVDRVKPNEEVTHSNLDFLSCIKVFGLIGLKGEEMVCMQNYEIGRLLSEFINDGDYLCYIRPPSNNDTQRWITLAENKFGQAVAGVYMRGQGILFFIPQIQKKGEFLKRLLDEHLPSIKPNIFPEHEGEKWIAHEDYQPHSIRMMLEEKKQMEEELRVRIQKIEEKITEERQKEDFMSDLIRESGDVLVAAVKRGLEVLDFSDVIDVDVLEAEESERKREDLRIEDSSPLLLIEVKGIFGTGREASVLQVAKYLIPRMKEMERLDIEGLSIINHQRRLEPLKRQANPFTSDVIDNAKEGFGLMTGWTLYRLIRNYQRWGWAHEDVKGLFYQKGFIEPIPLHYERLGVIENVYPKVKVVGIRLDGEAKFCVGDRIAIDGPIEFEEFVVGGLQIDRKEVDEGTPGNLVGVKHPDNIQVKEGMVVFRVVRSEDKMDT